MESNSSANQTPLTERLPLDGAGRRGRSCAFWIRMSPRPTAPCPPTSSRLRAQLREPPRTPSGDQVRPTTPTQPVLQSCSPPTASWGPPVSRGLWGSCHCPISVSERLCVAPESVTAASTHPADQPHPGQPESHIRRCQMERRPLDWASGSQLVTPERDPGPVGAGGRPRPAWARSEGRRDRADDGGGQATLSTSLQRWEGAWSVLRVEDKAHGTGAAATTEGKAGSGARTLEVQMGLGLGQGCQGREELGTQHRKQGGEDGDPAQEGGGEDGDGAWEGTRDPRPSLGVDVWLSSSLPFCPVSCTPFLEWGLSPALIPADGHDCAVGSQGELAQTQVTWPMTLGVSGSPPPLLPPVVMLCKCEVTPVNLHKCWAVSSAPCLSFGGTSDLSPLTFRLCCQSPPHKPPSQGCPRMGACPERRVRHQRPGLRGHSPGWRWHFSWTRASLGKRTGLAQGGQGRWIPDRRSAPCKGLELLAGERDPSDPEVGA